MTMGNQSSFYHDEAKRAKVEEEEMYVAPADMMFVIPSYDTPDHALAAFIAECKENSNVFVISNVDKDGYWKEGMTVEDAKKLMEERRSCEKTVVFNVLDYQNSGIPEPFYGNKYVMVMPNQYDFIQKLVFTDDAHSDIEYTMMQQANQDMEEEDSHMRRMLIRKQEETMQQFVKRVCKARVDFQR